MLHKFRTFSIITAITLFLWVLLDVLIGQFLLNKIKYSFHHGSVNPYYHHGFLPKIDNIFRWGNNDYTFCTDKNGFRNSCKKIKNKTKKFNIAFIGDSMTEGPGLNFEDTIVGIIGSYFKKKEIANLAASSYSTMIYNHKIRYLIKIGYIFDEVVVLIDISDIHDDSEIYKISNYRVVSKNRAINKYSLIIDKTKFHLKRIVPMTYQIIQKAVKLKNIKKNSAKIKILPYNNNILDNVVQVKTTNHKITPNSKEFKHIDLRLRAWTYDKNLRYDNMSMQDSINISLQQMNELYKFLNKKNISLSIVIFPAPPQLAFDNVNSLQVKVWENFCYQKCKHFINAFPYLFEEMKKTSFREVNKKYFIRDDVHFNRNGSEVIANLIIDKLK